MRGESERTGDMRTRVGFGSRFIAYMIDMAAVYGLGGMLGGFLGGTAGATAGAVVGAAGATASGSPGDAGAVAGGLGIAGAFFGAILGLALGIGVMALVFIVWEGATGTSLGKLMLGLRIQAEDGTPAGMDRLFFRAAIKHIGGVIFLFSAVPGLQFVAPFGGLAQPIVNLGMLLALTESKQTLHDQAAGTAVYGKS